MKQIPQNPETLNLTQVRSPLCFQFKSTLVTVNLVLTQPAVVMMTKMFHYITATAMETTVVKTVKVRKFLVGELFQRKLNSNMHDKTLINEYSKLTLVLIKRFKEKHSTRPRVFPYTSFVLNHFLCALQKSRAQ